MKRIFIWSAIGMFLIGCSSSDAPKADTPNNSSEWLVDEIDVTGLFSLFPLSENPDFTTISNVTLSDSELVGIVNFGSEIRVYPYAYSVQNEIINDTYSGRKYAFSYCPITKSSISFSRSQVYRASGYLFKSNLTPWDQKTETIWSQMLIKGIKGEKIGQRLNTIPVVETTWGTVKNYFPNAKVMAGTPPINNRSAFSKDDDDTTSGNDTGGSGDVPQFGEYVYGLLDDFDNVHVFRYGDFANKIITRNIRGQNYIIVGDASKRIINAFKVGNFDDYEIVENEFPVVLRNRNGIKYNILGIGSNGSVLEKPKYAYVAIWWAWDDIFTSFNFVE